MPNYSSAPICLLCQGPMQVIRTIPEVARLPEVLVFYCDGCGELETPTRSRCLLLLTRNRLRSQSADETYR